MDTIYTILVSLGGHSNPNFSRVFRETYKLIFLKIPVGGSMRGGRRVRPATAWDTMPRLEETALSPRASEAELDQDYLLRRRREDEVVEQYGPEDGRERILEDDIEMLVERLNAYERYVDDVERWRRRIQSRYLLVDRRKASGPDNG